MEPDHRPNPRKLVEEFVASGRSERAFAEIVESLGRLVYSSALRRTRNPQLAEEITQNVFAVLARRAEALRRHPCIRAWILETTRLQAASAMRGEKRRRRKADALAREATAQHPGIPKPMNNTDIWKDAVPHLDEALDRLSAKERDIIVQRYYEEKKFREIAAENGQTEGACKKRVKRALEKLSRALNARGVTPSSTVIVSALGTELARSAPAQPAALLGAEALAASSSLPATALLANTLQTISNLKTASLTTTAVLGLAAIPFAQQRAEATRIQAELELRTVTNLPAPFQQESAKSARTKGAGSKQAQGRSARSLLASLDGDVEHRAFIMHMMEVAGIPDPLARSAVASKLQRMSPKERMNLLRALKAQPMAVNAKDDLAKKILNSAGDMSPGQKMDELIVWGRSVSQDYMDDWATSDPDAAMQWFRERRTSGELDPGLGTFHRNLYQDTLRELLWGVSRSSPAKGRALYRQLPKEEIEDSALRMIAMNIARGEITKGEQRYYREMIDTHRGDDRKTILKGVLGAFTMEGRYDEGLAVVDEFVQSPTERDDYFDSIFRSNGNIGPAFDWLVASTPEEEIPAAMRRAVRTACFPISHFTLEWIERQEPGVVRDYAFAGYIEEELSSTFADDFPRVLPAADRIENPDLQAEIRQLIRTKWNEQDQEAISPFIPSDVLERLEDF